MTTASVVWEFQPGCDDFVPIGIFTKREDADLFQKAFTGKTHVGEFTMASVMDTLVTLRLRGLGLKLAIIEAPAEASTT